MKSPDSAAGSPLRPLSVSALGFLPLLLADALAVGLSHWLAYGLRSASLPAGSALPPAAIYLNMACFLALLTPLVFSASRVYSTRWRPLFVEISQIVLGTLLLSGVQLTAVFFFRHWLPHPDFTFSRLVALLGAGLTLLSVSLLHHVGRRWQQHAFRRGSHTRRVLLAGQPTLLERREHFLLQGIEIVSECAPEPAALVAALQAQSVDLVLLQPGDLAPSQLFDIFRQVCRTGAELWLIPDTPQLYTARRHLTELGGLPVVALQRTPLHHPVNRLLKRALDLAIVAGGLLLLAPLFGLIALAVRLGSPGPVFYRQTRISRNGELFDMLKFRTMRTDSEHGTGPVWASQNDPRVTPVGRFLRRSSLDELPQLLNVLTGQMSFVGPRPERPHFVKQFEEQLGDYPDRHLVQAGLTGWAQVNGLRGDTSIEERTRYDLYYIENWSLLLDMRIIARSFLTIMRDFWQKRAY